MSAGPAVLGDDLVQLQQVQGSSGSTTPPLTTARVFQNINSVANSGSSPSNAMTYTCPFNLPVGASLRVNVSGFCAANGNDKQYKLTCAALTLQTIIDSGTTTTNGKAFSITADIIRSDDTVNILYDASLTTSGVATILSSSSTDYVQPVIAVNIRGLVTNDLTVAFMTVDYIPKPVA